jgi:hypothetical protein
LDPVDWHPDPLLLVSLPQKIRHLSSEPLDTIVSASVPMNESKKPWNGVPFELVRSDDSYIMHYPLPASMVYISEVHVSFAAGGMQTRRCN